MTVDIDALIDYGLGIADGGAGQGAVIHEDYPQVYGGARKFWDYDGHEVILHGPYETGKTFAALLKFHKLMNEHPGAQGLFVRQTYNSLVGSACVTYEKKVLPIEPDMPGSKVRKFGGEIPKMYIYDNGSRIQLGGLDKPDKFLSAEYDYIYVNQAEEIDRDSWEKLANRATGRAGNTDKPQIIGDCNPSYPAHWIQQRDTIELIQQMHEYNPVLFNQETGEMTEQGRMTMRSLDAMTGVRHQRGRLGLWVQAEGAIFDNFSIEHNATDTAEYHPDWDVIWGVDDGYAHGEGPGSAGYHPRVILLAQVTPQGGVNIFYEYYRTGELGEQSIEAVMALSQEQGWKPPQEVYIDSSAVELRQRFWGRDFYSIPATHPVQEGIKNVRRLICDGHDVRLLHVHTRCKNLIREMQSYRYDENSKVANVGEPKPFKVDDHGPDALRYLTWHLRYES